MVDVEVKDRPEELLQPGHYPDHFYGADAFQNLVLEVDLQYPSHLHNSHSDFPICPLRQAIVIKS